MRSHSKSTNTTGEPLPAQVRVRVIETGTEGVIVGMTSTQIGTYRDEWFIVLLDDGRELVYQTEELETVKDG